MPVPLSEYAKALIDARSFATLCTLNPDGSPQASTMWLTRDGDDVIMSTVVGRVKERNMRRDPRVSVLVPDPQNPYGYAEIRGRVSLSEAGGRELIGTLAQKYEGRPFGTEPEGTVRVIVRITVERLVDHGG